MSTHGRACCSRCTRACTRALRRRREVLHGIDFGARGRGLDHDPARRQRRRQDDDAARALRHGPDRRARCASAASASTARATEDIVRLGIAHVPDGRGTFVDLSTEENLRLGAYVRKDRTAVAADFERMYGYFPRLKERRQQQAGTLSGGEQQMLAVSRALMLRPRLLLLDEPSFGLAPLIVQRDLRDHAHASTSEERVSILLVEQNAALALELADHAYLLETGRVVLSGSAGRDQQRRRGAPLLPRLLRTPWTPSCTRSSPASPPAASTPASRWRW